MECLTCKRKPLGNTDCLVSCDAKVKALGCRRCQTLYVWMPFAGADLSFMVPLTDEQVLDKAPSGWLEM